MQLADLPGIAAMSTSNMRSVNPPPCSEVIIAADNDDAGQEAARALAQRLANEGRTVRIATPEFEGEDWNDVLRQDGDNIEELRERIFGGELIEPERDVLALPAPDHGAHVP